MSEFGLFISKHAMQFELLLCAMLALFVIEWLRARSNTGAVSVSDAVLKINREHAMVLDVRDQAAYDLGHIQDAIWVSGDAKNFLDKNKSQKKMREKPYLIVCAQGVSAFKFANQLIAAGKTVYVLKGGMRAWLEANMPIVKSLHEKTSKPEGKKDE